MQISYIEEFVFRRYLTSLELDVYKKLQEKDCDFIVIFDKVLLVRKWCPILDRFIEKLMMKILAEGIIVYQNMLKGAIRSSHSCDGDPLSLDGAIILSAQLTLAKREFGDSTEAALKVLDPKKSFSSVLQLSILIEGYLALLKLSEKMSGLLTSRSHDNLSNISESSVGNSDNYSESAQTHLRNFQESFKLLLCQHEDILINDLVLFYRYCVAMDTESCNHDASSSNGNASPSSDRNTCYYLYGHWLPRYSLISYSLPSLIERVKERLKLIAEDEDKIVAIYFSL